MSKKWDKILTVILFLYPFRHINQGLDLMDAGYSLGHFQFRESMDPVWKIATFLSNWLGMVLSHLPFGKTWIGMNGYTCLLISIVAVVIFRWCCRKYPQKSIWFFAAEWIALSMCWAPSTVLYHYLGYFLFSISGILVFEAVTKDKKILYIIAGVILGLCVLVRMPNITYAALIIPVWYGAYLWRQDNRMPVVQQMLFCMLGYAIGLFPGLAWIAVKYGISAYPNMIRSLFAMTDTATDYKPTSMVTAMFSDYTQYSFWLCIFAVYLVIGILFFHWIKNKKIASYFKTVAKVLYCFGMPVVIRFCYGRGMFGLDYRDFFSVYKWVTVYLLCVILVCIYELVSKSVVKEDKLLASVLLVIIFITPLGSNNGLYPIMNNLFLIAPVSIYFFSNIYEKYRSGFAVRSFVPFLVICFMVQVTLFGLLFVFHDNDFSKRKVEITGFPSTVGMVTGVDKAEALEELGGYLIDKRDQKVLLYGYIPGISYVYALESAIYTTWIDLDSNSVQRLRDDLAHMEADKTLVILSTEAYERMTQADHTELTAKEQLIMEYMGENTYHLDFQNKMFTVYSSK